MAGLGQRLAAVRQREHAPSLETAKFRAETRRALEVNAAPVTLEERVRASGLFDPEVYLELHPDIPRGPAEAWRHFLRHGLEERRAFTNPLIVARLLAQMDGAIQAERHCLTRLAEAAAVHGYMTDRVAPLHRRGAKIGVFCSS